MLANVKNCDIQLYFERIYSKNIDSNLFGTIFENALDL